MIRGAVTVPLTDEQADRAATPDSLWIQGGTPEDPALFGPYPGEYGFAALRCAVDNLNGDNVEWIGYPAGASHSSVTPTTSSRHPRAARSSFARRSPIRRTQARASRSRGTSRSTPTGDSRSTSRTAPLQKTTFDRAATGPDDSPWTFAEDVPQGWHLTGIKCSSNTGAATERSRHGEDVRPAECRRHRHVHLHGLADPTPRCARVEQDNRGRRRNLRVLGHTGQLG